MSGRDVGGGSRTLWTSVGFRAQRDNDNDSGTAVSGDRSGGSADAGRLVGLSSTKICYDDGLANGLFPVAKFHSQTMQNGRFATGATPYPAASEATSFATGTTAPRDNRAGTRRYASSGILPPELSQAREDERGPGIFLDQGGGGGGSEGKRAPGDRIESRGRHNKYHLSN